MAVVLQQAKRQSVSCGYWPGMRMGTSATPTKTCATQLLPGLCSNLEEAKRAAAQLLTYAAPAELHRQSRTNTKSLKNLL